MKPASQLVGRRFGRLQVQARKLPNDDGYTLWTCICDCGKSCVVRGVYLTHGRKASCGCLLDDVRKTACLTHGKTKTPTYQSWSHMVQRCTNPRNKNYTRYGGRGIAVCERWLKFANFLHDMGEAPNGLTLDRIDNDGPYSPDNCRWATRAEQSRNSTTPVLLTHAGKTQNITEWAIELGIKPATLHMRVHRKWPVSRILKEAGQ